MRHTARLFWELARLAFERQFTYRAANLAGLITNLFFGVLRVALLAALYGTRTEAGGLTLADAITYTGLGQAMIAYLSLFGWDDVANAVYSGEVAGDLLRPLDYFGLWLARDAGRALAALLLRGVPILVLYAAFFSIVVPRSPGQWLALGAALLLAWLGSFTWRFLLNLSAFWTPNALGVLRFGYALGLLISGFLLPLRFFPDWFARLCYLTPFPAFVTTVIEVYLGKLEGAELAEALLLQLGWALGLAVLGQWALRRGVRRLVILGG